MYKGFTVGLMHNPMHKCNTGQVPTIKSITQNKQENKKMYIKK